jgi:hypothetical protein
VAVELADAEVNTGHLARRGRTHGSQKVRMFLR